jgi:hypothetical protein
LLPSSSDSWRTEHYLQSIARWTTLSWAAREGGSRTTIRVLGLPREAEVDRDVPFRDARSS